MSRMMEETSRRRTKQLAYNREHGIIPKTVFKSRDQIMRGTSIVDEERPDGKGPSSTRFEESESYPVVADPLAKYLTAEQREDLIANLTREMKEASKQLEFEKAAELRDSIAQLKAAK